MWAFLHYLKFYSELRVCFFVSNGERYEHVEQQDLSQFLLYTIFRLGKEII